MLRIPQKMSVPSLVLWVPNAYNASL
jgi:hypothetical protein